MFNLTINRKTINYNKINEFCSKHVDLAKSKYYKKYLDDYKDNSKKQWPLINNLLQLGRNSKNKRIKQMIDKNDNVISTPVVSAKKFNEHLLNIAKNLKDIMDPSCY